MGKDLRGKSLGRCIEKRRPDPWASSRGWPTKDLLILQGLLDPSPREQRRTESDRFDLANGQSAPDSLATSSVRASGGTACNCDKRNFATTAMPSPPLPVWRFPGIRAEGAHRRETRRLNVDQFCGVRVSRVTRACRQSSAARAPSAYYKHQFVLHWVYESNGTGTIGPAIPGGAGTADEAAWLEPVEGGARRSAPAGRVLRKGSAKEDCGHRTIYLGHS